VREALLMSGTMRAIVLDGPGPPEQLAGVPVREPLDAQLREAPRSPAARGDGQHLCRCLVEPLGVLEDARERLLLGNLGQEAEHGEADEKAMRCRARGQPEGGGQRVALRLRQTIEPAEHLRSMGADGDPHT
jgi:hypothetical protein